VGFDVQTDVFNNNRDIFLDPINQYATLKTITVDVPADGFLVLFGSVMADSSTGEVGHTAFGRLELFDVTSNTTFGTAWFADPSQETRTIQSVLPVTAGSRTLSLKVKCATSHATDYIEIASATGTFIAMFFPVRY
jgi:hypothetical protein